MNRLILHVGTHKTGTTSIQETLYYGLSDPRFQYVGFGQVNGSRGMATVFGDAPSRFRLHALMGLGTSEVERLRTRLERRLAGSLDTARRRGATPIISAEWCCLMSRGEMERVRQYFHDRHYTDIVVIIYLRPLDSYYASAFQEFVKYGGAQFVPFDSFDDIGTDRRQDDYLTTLELLHGVFGKDRVLAVPFVRESLHERCAVRDFCRRVGVVIPPHRIRIANETLSADATKLLYTYQARGGGYGRGRKAIEDNLLLKNALGALAGPPFRFHPSLLAQRADEIRRQHDAAARVLTTPFPPPRADAAEEGGVREEGDLFRYSAAALRWLARVTGDRGASPDGNDAIDWVVARMEALRRNPPVAVRLGRTWELARRELRRVVRGV